MEPRYTNMTHPLKYPEKYSGLKIQRVMQFDPGYVAGLIDNGTFKASKRARQELQLFINRALWAEGGVVDDLQAYINTIS